MQNNRNQPNQYQQHYGGGNNYPSYMNDQNQQYNPQYGQQPNMPVNQDYPQYQVPHNQQQPQHHQQPQTQHYGQPSHHQGQSNHHAQQDHQHGRHVGGGYPNHQPSHQLPFERQENNSRNQGNYQNMYSRHEDRSRERAQQDQRQYPNQYDQAHYQPNYNNPNDDRQNMYAVQQQSHRQMHDNRPVNNSHPQMRSRQDQYMNMAQQQQMDPRQMQRNQIRNPEIPPQFNNQQIQNQNKEKASHYIFSDLSGTESGQKQNYMNSQQQYSQNQNEQGRRDTSQEGYMNRQNAPQQAEIYDNVVYHYHQHQNTQCPHITQTKKHLNDQIENIQSLNQKLNHCLFDAMKIKLGESQSQKQQREYHPQNHGSRGTSKEFPTREINPDDQNLEDFQKLHLPHNLNQQRSQKKKQVDNMNHTKCIDNEQMNQLELVQKNMWVARTHLDESIDEMKVSLILNYLNAQKAKYDSEKIM